MSQTRYDVVVIGAIDTDFVAQAERLPRPGETLPGERFQASPGGKAANQAVAAARLGARAALIGRVGTDVRASVLLEALAHEDVDVQGVARDREAPTGASVVLVDGEGNRRAVTVPGANRKLSHSDIVEAAATIANSRVVVVQLECPEDVIRRALFIAREAGARTVLDPTPPVPLGRALLELVELVRPTAAEAETLTSIPVHDRRSAARAAKTLMDRGAEAVLIEAGNEGYLLVTSYDTEFLPRPDVARVDAAGAADAFGAALAVALADGWDLLDAAWFGRAAASLTTTRLGAQSGLPTRPDVMRLFSRWQGLPPARVGGGLRP